jgi:hypothetical protein
MLTDRLGLWEFLCEEVNTYRNLTIEFLSSYEFDRATRTMSFNMGGYHVSLHTTELLDLFHLPSENVEHMRSTLGFFPDMNEHQFRLLTMHDVLNDQRVKNISHPAIRYLQRVLSHSLFARGETASVFNEGDMTYILSMLRRNNGEMEYMPHITYNLAKHIKNIANNVQPGGIVRLGGIITKIANALHIPTGDDVVEGYTLVDLDGLVRARLIRYSDIHEAWINLGVNNIRHRLPLQTALDPVNFATWKIVDDPLEAEQQQLPPPLAQPQAHPNAAAQGEITMQQMWQLMQSMQTSINNLNLNVNNRMDTVDQRLAAFDQRMDEVETHAAAAHFYAHRGLTTNNPNYEDDPPTPPHQRRAAIRREAELARQREAEQAAQAAQEQEVAAEQEGEEEEEEEDDEEEESADDMDAE